MFGDINIYFVQALRLFGLLTIINISLKFGNECICWYIYGCGVIFVWQDISSNLNKWMYMGFLMFIFVWDSLSSNSEIKYKWCHTYVFWYCVRLTFFKLEFENEWICWHEYMIESILVVEILYSIIPTPTNQPGEYLYKPWAFDTILIYLYICVTIVSVNISE